MAVDFFFKEPTFSIQPLKSGAVFKWQRLKNPAVQYAVAAEEQYLSFHLYMLKQLRHTEAGKCSEPPYAMELDLSVRAGAVKAAILIAASIIEAALRSLAELRGYPLNADPKKRTFGNVIRSWEVNGQPQPEVAAIWPQIKAMHETRNYVHLHKAAGSPDASWPEVLKSEEALLNGALEAINCVAAIEA